MTCSSKRKSLVIQVGRQEPVMVLRVDKEKGYIDLSKRRVSPEDIALCEERYNKSKMIHSIMRHVAETTGQDVEELYKKLTWPLYKAYGHAFEAFKVGIRCQLTARQHPASRVAAQTTSARSLTKQQEPQAMLSSGPLMHSAVRRRW